MSDMTKTRPASFRGHKFRKQGNMLSNGCTLSESFYRCECGVGYTIATHMIGPPDQHYMTYSKIETDCPLSQATP